MHILKILSLRSREEKRRLLCDLCAIGIIVVTIIVHIYLVAIAFSQSNSDESTMGLMARHIVYEGKPVFMLYGQDYMGSLEAYLGAFFFLLFGPTVFALRLGVITEFCLFLIGLYILSCVLYSRKIALLALIVVAFGPADWIFRHVVATGSTAVFSQGVFLILLATLLVRGSAPGRPTSKKRYLCYGLWGFLAGFTFWSCPLALPGIVVSAFFILIFCWSELRSAIPVFVLACLLIGFSPYILFWFTVPTEQIQLHLLPWTAVQPEHTTEKKSVAVPKVEAIAMQAFQVAKPQVIKENEQLSLGPSIEQRVLGMVMVALPTNTGASQFCPVDGREIWPISERSSTYVLQCSAVHAGWGLAHIFFWGCAVWFAWRSFRRFWQRRAGQERKPEERELALLYANRLMLLAGAGLVVLAYTVSQVPALIPVSSSRYLVALQIATPAVLFGLWEVTGKASKWLVSRLALLTVRYAVLLLLIGTLLAGTVSVFARIPDFQRESAKDPALIALLEREQIRNFYSDYWTCNRLIFLSEERLTCSIVDEQLQPGLDRYLPYRALVQRDPQAAYLFKTDATQVKTLTQQQQSGSKQYSIEQAYGYSIYRPK